MTSDHQITPQDYVLLVEHVHETRDDVKEIKRAILGSMERDELGLMARMDIAENAVVRVQHEVGRLREDMERPRSDRRTMWREAMSGGIGGLIVFAAMGAWEWLKKGATGGGN